MIHIKDYLHFYLGCNVQFKGQEKKGKVNTENLWQLVSVHQMTYKKIATIEAMGCVKSLDPEDIKPILRPLSDMTEEEANVMWEIMGWNERIKGTERIGNILNEFTTIEDDNGHYMNSHWGYLIKIIPYMLKQGFDLFGLIDAGLAIYKTSIK